MIYRMSIKNIDDMELNEVCASIKEVWSNDYDQTLQLMVHMFMESQFSLMTKIIGLRETLSTMLLNLLLTMK